YWLREHPAQRGILTPQLEVLGGLAERVLDQGRLGGLAKVVEGPELHRRHAVVEVRRAGQDDDLARDAGFADAPECLEATGTWHAEIQEDDVERVSPKRLEGGLAALHALDLVP